MIATTGIFDVAEADYHADPCATPSLSSGIASRIVGGTLAEAHWNHTRLNPAFEPKDKNSTLYDLGNVFHTLVLGSGPEIVVIDAPDWKKKDAQAARANAFDAEQQPCLLGVHDKALAMRARLREQLDKDEDNKSAFVIGKPEVTAIAEIETPTGPIWCRARADWLERPTEDSAIIYDLKSWGNGCDPSDFVKYIYREDRDIQDPFYTLVFAKALGISPANITFRFVVQSAKEPYLLSVVQLDDQASSFSFERTRHAMHEWGRAMSDKQWPGYLPRTHFAAAPPYAMQQWAEKMAAEEFAEQLDARASEQWENENVAD